MNVTAPRPEVTPTERAASHSRLYVTAVSSVAAIGGFLFGFDTAVINGALVFLRREFALTDAQVELAVSSLLLGCVVGAAAAGPLTDRMGRRRLLAGAAILFAVSAIGAALPHTLAQFVTARVVGGLAIGIASMLAPIYIAEIAPPASRGRLVALNQLALVVGILVSYVTNWTLSHFGETSWRLMFGAALIPSVVFAVSLLWVPESPRWLLEAGRAREALAVLTRTLGAEAAKEELAVIQAAIAEESGRWRELFAPSVRLSLVVGVALAILQQVCGINVVIYYGSLIFAEQITGNTTAVALAASVLIGTVNLAATVLATILIDRIGRRPLLLVSSTLMGLGQVVLGAMFLLHPAPTGPILAVILACVAAFAVGLGPCLWVLLAEMFPNRVRGRAVSIATVALWAAAALVTSTFLTLSAAIGTTGAFWLYAGFCFVAAIVTWRAIPETRGRRLEDIEQSWRHHS